MEKNIFARPQQYGRHILSDVAYHPFFGRIVQYDQYRNIGSSRTLGAEANITWRPKPFMNIRLYANVYDYAYDAELPHRARQAHHRPGEWDKRHLPTFSDRLNVWVKLWCWGLRPCGANMLQVYANAHYTTATLALLRESKPSFQFDLGDSADLLVGRLSLFLNVDDIFATAQDGQSSLWYALRPKWSKPLLVCPATVVERTATPGAAAPLPSASPIASASSN